MVELRGMRMQMRFGLRALSLFAMLAFGTAWAEDAALTAAGFDHVRARKTEAYRAVLADFDASIQTSPTDAALVVARCAFIQKFTDEYGEWIESAPDDFEACIKALDADWPKEPQVQLFALQPKWGADAISTADSLLAEADAWPEPLRRQLFTKASELHEFEGLEGRAGELALHAARLGESSRVAAAVEHLISKQQFAEAAALLQGTPPATDAWQAGVRVAVALRLPDTQAAKVELLRHVGDAASVDASIAAKAHLRAGDMDAASKVLEGETDETDELKEIRFDLARAAGDTNTAVAQIDMTDAENLLANLQRFAIMLSTTPASLASPPMLIGAGVTLLILAVLSLLPGIVLMPAHYRGLARRAHGKPTTPLFDSIGLRQAWFAMSVMLCVPLLVAAALEPFSLAALLDGESVPDGSRLFRVMTWGTAIALLCLIPAMRSLGQRHLLGDRIALRGSWRVPLAWCGLFLIGLALAALNADSGGNPTVQTKMIKAMATGGIDSYGVAITLLTMALLVPIFEELVFRGLLLGGLTQHISFGWANLIQATLFASIHDDLPRFPFYLAMGLVAGWLVKKYRALGPAIALHVLNNGMAVMLKVMQ
ncbi:MAG: lysostaphin resistance A-like protein [Pseudomarimonas sp.]